MQRHAGQPGPLRVISAIDALHPCGAQLASPTFPDPDGCSCMNKFRLICMFLLQFPTVWPVARVGCATGRFAL